MGVIETSKNENASLDDDQADSNTTGTRSSLVNKLSNLAAAAAVINANTSQTSVAYSSQNQQISSSPLIVENSSTNGHLNDMTSVEILNKCHLDFFPKKQAVCDDEICASIVEQIPILHGEYIQFIGKFCSISSWQTLFKFKLPEKVH